MIHSSWRGVECGEKSSALFMWFLLIFRGSEQVCITKCGILEFPLHGGSYSPPKHELDLGNILLLAKASAASVAFFFLPFILLP